MACHLAMRAVQPGVDEAGAASAPLLTEAMLARNAGREYATKGLCEFGDKYYALVLRRAGHAVPATRSVQ